MTVAIDYGATPGTKEPPNKALKKNGKLPGVTKDHEKESKESKSKMESIVEE